MKNLLPCYGALLLIIFTNSNVFGQATDTIAVNWEVLPQPQKGVFTRYYQKADTLFGIYPEVHEVWQSSDEGLSWALYQDSVLDFAATDSFIYYKKQFLVSPGVYQQHYEARDNTGHISIVAGPDQSIFQYANVGISYYQVSYTKPLISVDEKTIAIYSTSGQMACQIGGCGTTIYSKLLRISTDAGHSFHTFGVPTFNGSYDADPVFAIHGDSVAILDNGRLFLRPATGGAIPETSSVADSLPQQNITWIGNCLTTWALRWHYTPYRLLRGRSFDNGATWIVDTMPVHLSNAKVTTRDTFTFLACPTGLYRSTNAQADSFIRIYAGTPGANPYIQSVLPVLPHIYANSSNNMLLHSADSGVSWTLGRVPTTDDQVNLFYTLDDRLNFSNPLSRYQWSEDSMLWRIQEMQLPDKLEYASRLMRFGGFLWMGGQNSNVFRSSDAGISWQSIPIVPAYAGGIVRLSLTNNTLVADVSSKMWMSKDTGTTWQTIEDYNINAWQVVPFGDTNIYLNRWRPKYVYRTIDAQPTNQVMLQTASDISALHQLPGHRLVVVLENGITYVSEDLGESWVQAASALQETAYGSYSTVVDSLLFYKHPDYSIPWLVSANGGVTYAPFNMPIYATAFYELDGYLYCTDSRQVLRTPIDPFRQAVLANSSKTGVLKGQVFFDANANCQADSSELPIVNKIIEITPGPRFVSTDSSGHFAVSLPIGTWTVAVDSLRYHAVCPATTVTDVIVQADSTRVQTFGFQATPNIYDGSITLTPFTPIRPGFAVSYRIKVKNEGTTSMQNDVVTCIFPADKLVYANAVPAPAYQNGDTLRWQLNALPTGAETPFTINFTAFTTLPLNTEVKLSANLDTDLPDIFPADNYTENIQTTIGSFDPNDKAVFPEGNFPISSHQLEYLIRFQNTGTDTAFLVRVIDTLDRDLDPMTLQVLDASHAYRLELTDNHVITWIFDPIKLPDSIHNEVASHGFIRFAIRTKADVLPYAKIPNSAAIYFDFNTPVLTNEVMNCLEKQVVWLDTAFRVACAGDTWSFNGQPITFTHDTTAVLQSNDDPFIIYNQYYQISVHGYYTTQDTTLYANTLFEGQLVTSDWDGSVRRIRHPGTQNCDSVWQYTVHVLPPFVSTTVPENLDFSLFPNPASAQVYLLPGNGLENKNLVLTIVNPLGVVCQSIKIPGTDHQPIILNLLNLAPGLYYVCLALPDGQQVVRKLVLAK